MLIAALLPRNLSSHLLWFHFISVPVPQHWTRDRIRNYDCTQVGKSECVLLLLPAVPIYIFFFLSFFISFAYFLIYRLRIMFLFLQTSDSRPLRYSYTCNLCNLTSMDNERWKSHKASHGNRTWKCRICEDLVEDKTILASHLMTEHNVSQGKTW
jgi:hypothetical protein